MADYPELRATPRGPLGEAVGSFAGGLARVRELAKSLEGAALDPTSRAALELVKLIIAQNPETLEKLSYGERALTEGSGETLRVKGEALDLANLVPPVAPLAGAVGRVAKAVATTPPPSKVARQAGVFVPAGVDKAALLAKLRQHDTGGSLTPEDVWAQARAIELPLKGGGRYAAEEIPAYKTSWNVDRLHNEANITGPLGDLMENQELYKRAPGLQDIQLELKHDPQKLHLGPGFYQGSQRPAVGNDPGRIKGEFEGFQELKQLMEHEVQHATQDVFNWPRGANVEWVKKDFAANPTQYKDIVSDIVGAHARAGNIQLARDIEETYKDVVKGNLTHADFVGGLLYQHSSGEIVARMAENRALLPPDQLALTPRGTVEHQVWLPSGASTIPQESVVPPGAHWFNSASGISNAEPLLGALKRLKPPQ